LNYSVVVLSGENSFEFYSIILYSISITDSDGELSIMDITTSTKTQFDLKMKTKMTKLSILEEAKKSLEQYIRIEDDPEPIHEATELIQNLKTIQNKIENPSQFCSSSSSKSIQQIQKDILSIQQKLDHFLDKDQPQTSYAQIAKNDSKFNLTKTNKFKTNSQHQNSTFQVVIPSHQNNSINIEKIEKNNSTANIRTRRLVLKVNEEVAQSFNSTVIRNQINHAF
jgi:hypothetical protein